MRSKKLLDTSILIRYWREARRRTRSPVTIAHAQAWARQLIELRETNAIVTPVYIEMMAGVTNRNELKATRAFLAEFSCIDEGNIAAADWAEAIRLAQRVPRNARPRQLADCLIRAIANRLHHFVLTIDTGFPR